MATYEEARDKLMVCPYDSSHLVKESRYQLHLSKCEKNHLNAHKSTCPFNARHRPDHGELSHHLLNCNCRAAVDKLLVSDSNDTYRGHVGVPSYHSQKVETGENWDDEIQHPESRYVPNREPPAGGIRTDFSGMLPSVRKQYYRNLHHKNGLSDEKPEKNANLPELREPKTKSYAQMLDQGKPVHKLDNIGLGRGQPVAASASGSRIAANIFGQPPVPTMRQPKTKPLGFQASRSLGMGRGSNADNGGNMQYDSKFLSLGGF